MENRSRWWIVVASTLAMVVSNGSINTYGFSVLLKPVAEDLGITRGIFSAAMSAALLVTAVAIPFLGAAVDRYGYRRCLLIMIPLHSVGVASLALLPANPAIVFVMFAMAGLLAIGQTPNAYSKAITLWFDRERGLALGIAISGVGLGTVLMPQYASYLLQHVGWRGTYIGLAIAILLFAFVPVLLFLRDPGSRNAMVSRAALVGLTRRDAVGTPQFRAIALAFFLGGVVIVGALAHLVSMISDKGMSPVQATAALSVAGVALIIGRLAAGYALDRVFAPYVTIFFFVCPILGISLLLFGGSYPFIVCGAVLLGAAIGADIDLLPFLISRYFGVRHFAEIYGLLFGIFLIGNAIGPAVLGFTFDATGSYDLALYVFEPLLVVACFLLMRLGPYVYPSETPGDRGLPVNQVNAAG